jgi:cytochrome c-type biogenesis protein CcsB
VPVNTGLAAVSNDFLLAAVAIYALAMLAYAFDFAFGARKAPAVPAVRARELVGAAATAPARAESIPAGTAAGGGAASGGAAAGAGAGDSAGGDTPDAAAPGPGAGAAAAARTSAGGWSADLAEALSRWLSRGPARFWVTLAVLLNCTGLTAHVTGVVLRGLAVHRLPWGDMYEFVTALTCVAVTFFVFVMIRYRAYYMGLFVMAAVVIVLGLAETVIYTPAGPLVPALQSYWLAIHVTAMTLATGVFFVAAVTGITYLVVDRHARRVAVGRPVGADGILRRLPRAEVLDRLAYRTVVFGFPIWTFGVIAGAIWADKAWGSYWSWDPTEIWAFITWIVYACFLHARATAGWRGRRAAYIQLLGFCCLLFNVLVISLVVPGLHSYAGLT